jgi:hypothetical protein
LILLFGGREPRLRGQRVNPVFERQKPQEGPQSRAAPRHLTVLGARSGCRRTPSDRLRTGRPPGNRECRTGWEGWSPRTVSESWQVTVAARAASREGSNADRSSVGMPGTGWSGDAPGRIEQSWPAPWRGTKPMEGEADGHLATGDRRYGPDSGAKPRGRGSPSGPVARLAAREARRRGGKGRGDAARLLAGGLLRGV